MGTLKNGKRINYLREKKRFSAFRKVGVSMLLIEQINETIICYSTRLLDDKNELMYLYDGVIVE